MLADYYTKYYGLSILLQHHNCFKHCFLNIDSTIKSFNLTAACLEFPKKSSVILSLRRFRKIRAGLLERIQVAEQAPWNHPSWEKWPGFRDPTGTQIWEDFPWILLGWHGKNPPNPYLGGGFKYFLFSPRSLGKWSNLTNIFQMGWNHQLEMFLGVGFSKPSDVICVPFLARPQKCEKKEELIKDLRDEIEEQQLESSQAFMNLGWTFWSNINIWFAKLYPAMFDTNSKCCLGDATWLLWNLSCDNLHHQRLVKKTKVAVKLSSDVTSRNKCFWNLHLKPFSGRKQLKVNRCLVGNLKEVRSASLPFRKASSLGIGWGEYWPWNGILFRQEGWSFPPIPPWKWTNDECSLKKGTISRGQFIFQPSILKGHIKGFVDVFWLFCCLKLNEDAHRSKNLRIFLIGNLKLQVTTTDWAGFGFARACYSRYTRPWNSWEGWKVVR